MHLLISYNCKKKNKKKTKKKKHCKQSSKNPSDAMMHDGALSSLPEEKS